MANNEEHHEPEYEVKDKRRVNPDGTLKEEAEPSAESAQAEPVAESVTEEPTREAEQPEQQAAEPGEEGGEEGAEEGQEMPPMPPPDIYNLLQFMAGLLSEQAWYHMGIRLMPGQKEATKDLKQAKLAIDTLVFISDQIHPHVGEEERRALRALVTDLQMNFVRLGQ